VVEKIRDNCSRYDRMPEDVNLSDRRNSRSKVTRRLTLTGVLKRYDIIVA